jgi:hypothetical protein
MRSEPRQHEDYSGRCYCLDHVPGGLGTLAQDWRERLEDKDVFRAVAILREKFEDPASFGPQQVVEFYHSQQAEERAMQARRAFELVREFLKQIDHA